MSLDVLTEGTGICVALGTAGHLAAVGSVLVVCARVLKTVAGVGVALSTTLVRTHVRLLSCVRAGVYFEVLQPGKALAADGTLVGFLVGVCADVYQHLVPGVEAAALARAPLPVAAVA